MPTASPPESPAGYLTRRRVERAKDLLRSANLTVTEVCTLVGFASLGSFSRRFSELVGMPPSAVQRRSAEAGLPPVPGCFVMDWARPRPATPVTAAPAALDAGAACEAKIAIPDKHQLPPRS
ncbi:MAG TPA: helix-turn-helix transcriptional regulator [Acidimicrobiales bacterium]|nr:helix-turn-helix transcriptional regulator [Acidimicrobiales bacterium]